MPVLSAAIASRNDGKIQEIKRIIRVPGLKLLTYEDFDVWPELPEAGISFEENAISKASTLATALEMPAIADDSGLEVKALDGRPGVLSARYAGPAGDTAANNAKLLKDLAGIPPERRGARFVCVAAFAEPAGWVVTTVGVLEGSIGLEQRGAGGFGYDPLFVPAGRDLTLAEMVSEEKDAISHRGKAFRQLKIELGRLLKTMGSPA